MPEAFLPAAQIGRYIVVLGAGTRSPCGERVDVKCLNYSLTSFGGVAGATSLSPVEAADPHTAF